MDNVTLTLLLICMRCICGMFPPARSGIQCPCATSMFAVFGCARVCLCVRAQHKDKCKTSMCYIKHLTLVFPFPPVGHGVQEEMGFSGYQAGGGGPGFQHRLGSCALGYALSCEFWLFVVLRVCACVSLRCHSTLSPCHVTINESFVLEVSVWF